MRARADGLKLLLRRHSGGIGPRDALSQQHLQAADADHEELIEVRCGDRQEFQPFQQRHAGVLSLREHALIEFQPTEFAVEVFGVGRGVSHGAVP